MLLFVFPPSSRFLTFLYLPDINHCAPVVACGRLYFPRIISGQPQRSVTIFVSTVIPMSHFIFVVNLISVLPLWLIMQSEAKIDFFDPWLSFRNLPFYDNLLRWRWVRTIAVPVSTALSCLVAFMDSQKIRCYCSVNVEASGAPHLTRTLRFLAGMKEFRHFWRKRNW